MEPGPGRASAGRGLLRSSEAAAPDDADLWRRAPLGQRGHHGLLHRALCAHRPLRAAAGEFLPRDRPRRLPPRSRSSGRRAGGRPSPALPPAPTLPAAPLALPSPPRALTGSPCGRALSPRGPGHGGSRAPAGRRHEVQALLPGRRGSERLPSPWVGRLALAPPHSR